MDAEERRLGPRVAVVEHGDLLGLDVVTPASAGPASCRASPRIAVVPVEALAPRLGTPLEIVYRAAR